MPQAVPVSQNGDWRLDVAFFEASVDTPRDLTEAQAAVVVQAKDGGAPQTFQLNQGVARPEQSNFVSIWVPQATVQQWAAGLWQAEVRLTWPDNTLEVAAAFDFRVAAFGLASPVGRLNVFRSAPLTTRRL